VPREQKGAKIVTTDTKERSESNEETAGRKKFGPGPLRKPEPDRSNEGRGGARPKRRKVSADQRSEQETKFQRGGEVAHIGRNGKTRKGTIMRQSAQRYLIQKKKTGGRKILEFNWCVATVAPEKWLVIQSFNKQGAKLLKKKYPYNFHGKIKTSWGGEIEGTKGPPVNNQETPRF